MNFIARHPLGFASALLVLALASSTAMAGTDINDLDGDGFPNASDNCPFHANPSQADADGDGIGNDCDARDDRDLDGDSRLNHVDNCPFNWNLDQQDSDDDGRGDVCDPRLDVDPDGDGIYNQSDNCPYTNNGGQQDADGDGKGDVCDPFDDRDLDRDFTQNAQDNCPFTTNFGQEDSDGDGHGDACDPQPTAADLRPATDGLAFAAPNPSPKEFTVRFALAEGAEGSLAVYDVTGRLVRTLERGTLSAGDHAVTWDGRSESGVTMPGGIYFCRLQSDRFSFEQTLVKLDR
jgi:hypothetical protein